MYTCLPMILNFSVLRLFKYTYFWFISSFMSGRMLYFLPVFDPQSHLSVIPYKVIVTDKYNNI